MSDSLSVWTIYDRPLDHPRGFVVRLWLITRSGPAPTRIVLIDLPTLAIARSHIPPGLVRLPRMIYDDPKIVETWV